MSAPLTAVLIALRSNALSVPEIVERSGLDPDTVRAALAHLRHLGLLPTSPPGSGCPPVDCGSCALRGPCVRAHP